MIGGAIRPLALCIIKNKDKVLVMDGYDQKKDQVFYRLLGGGIEFSERGEEALRREFQEELATGLENIKFITTLENIFTFNGKQGHEIILIFEGDLANKDLYQQPTFDILDSNGQHHASWQEISNFRDKKLIIYPENILDYL